MIIHYRPSVLQQHPRPQPSTRKEADASPGGRGSWGAVPGGLLLDMRLAGRLAGDLPWAGRVHLAPREACSTQRDFTPTRTTMRTMMITNSIKITSIFRFFF